MPAALPVAPLFGGAMSMCVPPSYVDVSTFRQVPDNQEVYVHIDSSDCTVVELVNYEAGVADSDAATYYWNDLVQTNECEEGCVRVLTPACVPLPTGIDSIAAQCIVGQQGMVRDRRTGTVSHVVTFLCVIRLPAAGTDVLVSWNRGLSVTHPRAEAHTYAVNEAGGRDVAHDEAAAIMASDMPALTAMLASLKVHDWGLFAA